MFSNNKKKQIMIKQEQLKQLKESYETKLKELKQFLVIIPSEYKILQMISDKYNVSPDLEEKINEYLQRIKMNKNLETFQRRNFYKQLINNDILKERGGFDPYINNWNGIHLYEDYMIKNARIAWNINGLKNESYCSSYNHSYIKRMYSKSILIELLDMNKIKYLKSDTKHALICRLLNKDPKDPVYTKEIRKRV